MGDGNRNSRRFQKLIEHYPLLGLVEDFYRPLVFLLFLIVTGAFGYHIIEGWSFLDAIYMTLITFTTVGFGEVHELSESGKAFTIIMLVGGVIFYAAAFNAISRALMEYKFQDAVNKIRNNRKISKMKDHYIICGGGRMALAIGEELERAGYGFLFIEKNPESIVSEYGKAWPVIHKDALLEEVLIEAGVERARGLAAVLPTDADNLFVVLSARRLNPDLFIQTRIALENTRSKMLQAGASRVVSPYNAGGIQIARTFVNPEVDDFLSVVIDRASYEFEMKIHEITGDDPYREKAFAIQTSESRVTLWLASATSMDR